jgi:hypothetical protein
MPGDAVSVVECTCGDGACMLCDDCGMQHHVAVSTVPERNWHNDDIQFPRLLSELSGVLTKNQIADVAESMDLPVARVEELLGRAESAWEAIVSTTDRMHDASRRDQ